MSKPKDVVLGRGELGIAYEHGKLGRTVGLWTHCYGGRQLYLRSVRMDMIGEPGALIWRPDPPKRKR